MEHLDAPFPSFSPFFFPVPFFFLIIQGNDLALLLKEAFRAGSESKVLQVCNNYPRLLIDHIGVLYVGSYKLDLPLTQDSSHTAEGL